MTYEGLLKVPKPTASASLDIKIDMKQAENARKMSFVKNSFLNSLVIIAVARTKIFS